MKNYSYKNNEHVMEDIDFILVGTFNGLLVFCEHKHMSPHICHQTRERIEKPFVFYHIYQLLRLGRIWHKLNF